MALVPDDGGSTLAAKAGKAAQGGFVSADDPSFASKMADRGFSDQAIQAIQAKAVKQAALAAKVGYVPTDSPDFASLMAKKGYSEAGIKTMLAKAQSAA